MTRKEAFALGLSVYDSDKPCPAGHVGKRRTRNWTCMECHRLDAKMRAKASGKKKKYSTAEQRRWYKKKAKYGIGKVEAMVILENQNGLCPGCQSDIREAFDIEHCHDTGRVRGLMCHPCNKALAFARDRSDTLRRLADYLDKKDYNHDRQSAPC